MRRAARVWWVAVVVVNRQMPGVGLSLGLMDTGGTGEGWCVELRTRNTQAHTRSTQVQGPGEEVNPYSCLSVCIWISTWATKSLVELYALRAKSYEVGKRVELGLSGKYPPSLRGALVPLI